MNRKQLILLLAASLVLGGVGFYLMQKRSASFASQDRASAGRLLGEFPVNDVAWITVRQGTNEVNLVKGEVWTVRERGDYPAGAEELIEFARKLWDLRPAQSQKIGPSQLGRLDLLSPDAGGTNTGILVELKGKDGKRIRSLVLGKTSMRSGGGQFGGDGGWPAGRWVYLPDQPGTAYVVSEAFTDIEPGPAHWLKKDFVHVEKARSISVDFPAATNSWKLTRETEKDPWKLAEARPHEQLDAAKAGSFANPLAGASFNDVMPGGKLETGGLKPTVLKIETLDNFTYTINVGPKTNEDYFVTVAAAGQLPKERTPDKDEKPEDKARLDKEFKERLQKLEEKLKQEQSLGKWTFLVGTWTMDSVMKERSQLLAEKTPADNSPTNAVDVPKIENPPLPPVGTNAGAL